MRRLQTVVLSFAVFIIAFTCNSLHAQTATAESQPVGIAITIAMQKNNVPVGQAPIVIFGVDNLTDHEMVIHDSMYRLHVEGEQGEPPTTYIQRWITHKLRPGEPDMRADEWAIWTIWPGIASEDHKFIVSALYDVSAPGKYSAYVEVMDPTSKKWLRSRLVKFEVEPVTK